MSLLSDLNPALLELEDDTPFESFEIWQNPYNSGVVYSGGVLVITAPPMSAPGQIAGVFPTAPTDWVFHVVLQVRQGADPSPAPGVMASGAQLVVFEDGTMGDFSAPENAVGGLNEVLVLTVVSDGNVYSNGVLIDTKGPLSAPEKVQVAAYTSVVACLRAQLWDSIPTTLQADMDALVAEYVSGPPPAEAGAYSEDYASWVAQSLLGDDRSPLWTETMYVGLLGPEGPVSSHPRVRVSVNDFTPVGLVVANSVAIDLGVAADDFSIVGLQMWDAPENGAVVFTGLLSAPVPAVEGDPLVVPVGGWTVGAA